MLQDRKRKRSSSSPRAPGLGERGPGRRSFGPFPAALRISLRGKRISQSPSECQVGTVATGKCPQALQEVHLVHILHATTRIQQEEMGPPSPLGARAGCRRFVRTLRLERLAWAQFKECKHQEAGVSPAFWGFWLRGVRNGVLDMLLPNCRAVEKP